MTGDLPPSSSVTRFSVSVAARLMILPTSVEPVNATLSTSGWRTRRSPAVSPMPVTMLTTPAGIPASATRSASLSAVSGVCSAGFNTSVQPAARAGAIFCTAIINGKFHGTICAATPIGSRRT